MHSIKAMPSVKLRPATHEDKPFLLQVYFSTRNVELEGLGWEESQKQAFLTTQFEAQERCYPKGDNRIILLGDCPVGRILVDRSTDTILLVDIALLEKYRNSGVGTALVKELLREAAAGRNSVRLHVLNGSAAVRLYERLGFSRVAGNQVYFEMVWVPRDAVNQDTMVVESSDSFNSEAVVPYRLSPYVHFIESHLIASAVHYGVFHLLTGEVLEPGGRVRLLLLAAQSGNRISLSAENLDTLGEDGTQIRELIQKGFLIPEGSDALATFVDHYVVRPMQNPALAYRGESGEMLVVRMSMEMRLFSPQKNELPAIIEESLTPVATQIFLMSDGKETLREILKTLYPESNENILEEGGAREAVNFLTSSERQLVKFTRRIEDLEEPFRPCNTVPRNYYHSSKWAARSQEDSGRGIVDFHLDGIEDASWEFDQIETTVNHAFRFRSPALGWLDYGSRFCASIMRPELLPSLDRLAQVDVLEVGGGTGTFARSFLDHARVLNATTLPGLQLRYHIMDLSPVLIENQRELLAQVQPPITHYHQDATRFDLPDQKFDLIVANEVIADFPVALVKLSRNLDRDAQGSSHAPNNKRTWEGEGAYYLEKYNLGFEGATDSFLINVGAIQFIERAWDHLSPGGMLVVSEYAAHKHPSESYHLNHAEFSIHFGHLVACASKMGFECSLLTLKEFLALDDQVCVLAGREEQIQCLNHVLRKKGMLLPYAVVSRIEFEDEYQEVAEQLELTGVSFLPLEKGYYFGPRIDEFMVLLMSKPC